MTLMFQRLARNFVKDGYFPTDSESTARILTMLEPCRTGSMRILDPCAGEGVALAECKNRLGADRTEAFGVEFDRERARHAKTLLDRAIHGDYQETVVTPKSFGLIWLNPPYGDLVSDQAANGDKTGKGRKRLEKMFYQRAVRLLQPDGILVLIVPHYSLDREFSGWIGEHLEQIAAFRAVDPTYKQAVVVGTRRREPAGAKEMQEVRRTLETIRTGDVSEILPEVWPGEAYTIPAAPSSAFRFQAMSVDAEQLGEEIARFPCLWPQFRLHLGKTGRTHRPPLRALSKWHIALSLAAGQVSGAVRSNDGERIFVIKGDTYKRKKKSTTFEELASGAVTEIRTETDEFVAAIRALDFTPGSETFGKALIVE